MYITVFPSYRYKTVCKIENTLTIFDFTLCQTGLLFAVPLFLPPIQLGSNLLIAKVPAIMRRFPIVAVKVPTLATAVLVWPYPWLTLAINDYAVVVIYPC